MIRNIAANYIGRLVSIGTLYVCIPAYIRLFGYEQYSIIAFYTLLQSIFIIADAGLSATLTREAARLKDQNEIAGVLFAFERILLAVGLAIGGTLAALSYYFAHHWLNFQDPGNAAIASQCLLMIAASIPFQLLSSLYAAGLIGLQQQILSNALMSVATLVRYGFVIAPLMLYGDIRIFFGFQLAVLALYALSVRFALLRTLERPGLALGRWPRSGLAGHVHFASGMMIISITSILNSYGDRIVTSKLLSSEQFSQYSLAITLAQLPYLLIFPIFVAMNPTLTRTAETGSRWKLKREYFLISYAIASIVISAGVGIIAFAPEILAAWLGKERIIPAMVDIFRLGAAGYVFLSLSSLPFYLGLAHGYNRLSVALNLIFAPLAIVGVIFAIRHYGMSAAAVPWFVINLANMVILIFALNARFLRSSLAAWQISVLLAPAACAAVLLLGARWAAAAAGWQDLPRLTLGVVAGLVSLVALWAFRWQLLLPRHWRRLNRGAASPSSRPGASAGQ